MAKGKKQNYGNYIIDNKEQLLKIKKQRLMIKKSIFFILLLIGILTTLCFTLPIFNLQEVIVEGNSKVTSEDIEVLAAPQYGENIFKLRTNEVSKNVLQNPYIYKAKVKRKIPNTLVIDIAEREKAFFVQAESGFYIIDENGSVLEKIDKMEEPFLLKLQGISEENLIVGEKIKGIEDNNLESLSYIYQFINKNSILDRFSISMIEINDFIGLKLYVNNLYIKIGTMDDLFNKLSRGFNILNNSEITQMKGYIDVSFEGNPVIYKE